MKSRKAFKMPEHLFVSSDGAMHDTRRPDWASRPLRPRYGAFSAMWSTPGTLELRAALRARYTWPGGYELVFLTHDGFDLCRDCVFHNYRQISRSIRHKQDDGWRVIGCETADTLEGHVRCEHCDRMLHCEEDSDYAE